MCVCVAICVASLFASVCCKLVLLHVLQACVCRLLDYMFYKFVLLPGTWEAAAAVE